MRLAVVLGLLLCACKGDAKKCEQMCRNYFTLTYWKQADVELAAAPPEQRDAVRKRQTGEFDSRLGNGLDLCVTKCRSANNDDDMECMLAAKTADQAIACTK
jgi:hypothetical protein